MNLFLLFMAASAVGAGGVVAWRLREVTRPVTLPKIVIPPLGMSTGFAMFIYPPTRIPVSWALLAMTLGGMVLAWPLVVTSRLTRAGDQIFVKRSPAFLWVLLGLLVVRFSLRGYIEHYVSWMQTAGLFFCLAFGMVARWRLSMLADYLRLREQAPGPDAVVS